MKDTTQVQNSSNENNSYVTYFPSALLEDANLSDEELVTFLHISKFLHRDGYATCSDAWLMERRRCSVDKIQSNLKSLEEKGIIYRETWKEGMYWKRRIWLPQHYAQYLLENDKIDEKFKNCLRIGKNANIEVAKMPTSSGQKCQHNKRSTKRKKNTTTRARESSAAPPDSLLFSSDQPWMEDLTSEEQEKLKAYYETQKHKIKNPRAWLRTASLKKFWLTKTPTTEERTQKNEIVAKWIISRHPRADIVEGYNYLEFVNGTTCEHLKFSDKDFEEKCKKELERRGLDLAFQD